MDTSLLKTRFSLYMWLQYAMRSIPEQYLHSYLKIWVLDCHNQIIDTSKKQWYVVNKEGVKYNVNEDWCCLTE